MWVSDNKIKRLGDSMSDNSRVESIRTAFNTTNWCEYAFIDAFVDTSYIDLAPWRIDLRLKFDKMILFLNLKIKLSILGTKENSIRLGELIFLNKMMQLKDPIAVVVSFYSCLIYMFCFIFT